MLGRFDREGTAPLTGGPNTLKSEGPHNPELTRGSQGSTGWRSFPSLHRAAVLGGVEGKPCGWPPGTLDTASGRLLLAATENDAWAVTARRAVADPQG